jgi:hypothetical protein
MPGSYLMAHRVGPSQQENFEEPLRYEAHRIKRIAANTKKMAGVQTLPRINSTAHAADSRFLDRLLA